MMEPEIVYKEGMKLAGVVYYGDNSNDEIPAFWKKHFATIENLPGRVGQGCYGFCFHTGDYTEKGYFHYMPAVEVSDLSQIPMGAVGKTVPPHHYAVFTHRGNAEKLKDVYDFIYGTWLPHKKYRVNEEFDFEY